jgi:hypothetical protein
LRDLNLSQKACTKKERTRTQDQQRQLPHFHRFPRGQEFAATSSQMRSNSCREGQKSPRRFCDTEGATQQT